MATQWQIKVYENRQLVYSGEVDGTVELGRQIDKEPPPYFARKLRDRDHEYWRVVVAKLSEIAISRKHVLIEPISDDRARLHNKSATLAIRFPDNRELKPGQSSEENLPIVIALDKKTIRIQGPDEDDGKQLYSLANMTVAPGQAAAAAHPTLLASIARGPGGLDMEELVRWLQAAMDVLQAASGSSDFFMKAARAVVDLVDMDTGRILLWQDNDWKVAAVYAATPRAASEDRGPAQSILSRILREKRTFWQVPSGAPGANSLAGVDAVVAAPVLNPRGEITGALYGERRLDAKLGAMRPVSRLEAMLVELLAGGVATGLARMEQEKAALRARVQFEQFFTPELTSALANQPDLLEGRDATVTLLFADIRRFSHYSAKLGPARTFAWIGDVMKTLSDAVLEQDGVLVDYIGDELMAMWGAPRPQPDQAARACRAALAMRELLPKLNADWQKELGGPMDIGVGINTGEARVGNTGSLRKFKYGPLGNTVNLASRVQGATKYLKAPVLITEDTRQGLDASFAVRRVGSVRVVNIEKPVALYELGSPGRADWASLQSEYEAALRDFEDQDFRSAARILGNLLDQHQGDGPSLVLLSRAVNALIEGTAVGHPVWELPSK